MKVIILVGGQNSGKTTTLKKLIAELCLNRGANIQNVQGVARCSTFITEDKVTQKTLEQYMNQHLDVTIVIEYNNKRIGITTIGDGWELIKEQFDRMGCCDIMICASHNRQNIFNSISAYHNSTSCRVTSIEKIYQIKCIQDQPNSNIQKVYDLADSLAVDEIISHL